MKGEGRGTSGLPTWPKINCSANRKRFVRPVAGDLESYDESTGNWPKIGYVVTCLLECICSIYMYIYLYV